MILKIRQLTKNIQNSGIGDSDENASIWRHEEFGSVAPLEFYCLDRSLQWTAKTIRWCNGGERETISAGSG